MRKLRSLAALIPVFLIALYGCKKDHHPKPEEPGNALKVNVKVTFPAGTNLKVSDYRLFSSAEFSEVSGSGEAKAIHNKGGRSIAVLLNAQDEPVLMGFITDSKSEISIASTVEVVQYLALGTVFMPEEIREMYVAQEVQLPGTGEFVAKAEKLFSGSENFLVSPGFANELEERVRFLTSREQVDINSRLNIKPADIKSGLQVEEIDFKSVLIANTFRRRAHGFLYKMGFITENGSKTTLINDVPKENAASVFDISVSPTQSISGFTGVLQDAAAGTGIQFARTSTDPITMELAADQLQCTYQVRVVGPSAFAGVLTNAEETKLRELEFETLAFDMALPIFLDIVGHAEILDNIDEKKFKAFAKSLELFAKSVPAVVGPLREGDYKKALSELFVAMGNNAAGDHVEDMFKALIDGVLTSAENLGSDYFAQSDKLIMDRVGTIMKTIKVVDYILKFVDYSRIFAALGDSKMMEQWEVISKRSKITLTPVEAVAFPFVTKYIQAIIKDVSLSAGQSIEFKWSTTGTYGVLKDDMGHEGVSFSNSSTESKKEISYFSRANESSLPEDATDKIFVEAFVKEAGKDPVALGRDTAIVRVRAFKYELKPKNILISGGTDLSLYIQRPDGSEDITNNPALDYKIVWTTKGNYGLLKGYAKSLTSYNDNQVVYTALDKKVAKSSEVVTARVYGKPKNEGDEGYELYVELETTIIIENDPNKKIFYVPLTAIAWGPTVVGTYTNCGAGTAFMISPVARAKSYTATVISFSPEVIPRVTGTSKTWSASTPVGENGKYEFAHISSGALSSPTWLFNSGDCQKYMNSASARKGMAQVVVTLEPE